MICAEIGSLCTKFDKTTTLKSERWIFKESLIVLTQHN